MLAAIGRVARLVRGGSSARGRGCGLSARSAKAALSAKAVIASLHQLEIEFGTGFGARIAVARMSAFGHVLKVGK
jgi:hypothetical protein